MRLYIDCRAGISGDMFLAALADLGLDMAPLEAMFKKAGLDLDIKLRAENRQAGTGRGLSVLWPDSQPLRHLPDILAILDKLDCNAGVRALSAAAFKELARAEARVHGCPVEDIHFHEVGAVDTLVDVVGAFWGLETLQVASVSSSPLPWFSGTVTCEHGVIPLPAPATLELMAGRPVFPSGAHEELVTPTGALVLTSILDHYGHGTPFAEPCGVIVKSGLGYGSRPSAGGLRLILLQDEGSGLEQDRVTVLESHLDHLSGEELGHALEAIMRAGALDVLWLPGLMKKGRPGGCLRVLCREEDEAVVRDAFFRHTHTLGIRRCSLERHVLPRAEGETMLAGEKIKAKLYALDGRRHARPEYEALKALAGKRNQTLPDLRFEEKED